MFRRVVLFFALFLTASPANALPVCQPYAIGAKYVSRWQQTEGDAAWEADFICDNRRVAKIHAEEVDDPAKNDGLFFIVDPDGVLITPETFDSPCDAVEAFCAGRVQELDEETKAMLVESLQEAAAAGEPVDVQTLTDEDGIAAAVETQD